MKKYLLLMLMMIVSVTNIWGTFKYLPYDPETKWAFNQFWNKGINFSFLSFTDAETKEVVGYAVSKDSNKNELLDIKKINRVYRRLAIQYHPDKFKENKMTEEDATKKFNALTRVFEAISQVHQDEDVKIEASDESIWAYNEFRALISGWNFKKYQNVTIPQENIKHIYFDVKTFPTLDSVQMAGRQLEDKYNPVHAEENKMTEGEAKKKHEALIKIFNIFKDLAELNSKKEEITAAHEKLNKLIQAYRSAESGEEKRENGAAIISQFNNIIFELKYFDPFNPELQKLQNYQDLNSLKSLFKEFIQLISGYGLNIFRSNASMQEMRESLNAIKDNRFEARVDRSALLSIRDKKLLNQVDKSLAQALNEMFAYLDIFNDQKQRYKKLKSRIGVFRLARKDLVDAIINKDKEILQTLLATKDESVQNLILQALGLLGAAVGRGRSEKC